MHAEPSPNLGRSSEALAARLRSLPPPPVPDGLESRLLAAVPVMRQTPRRWIVWVSLAGALAAACLLAVLAWSGRNVQVPGPTQGPGPDITQRPADMETFTIGRDVEHGLAEAQNATFNWPLEEMSPITVATAPPADVLD